MKRQGFTLIEIIIGMVLAGLLLAGVTRLQINYSAALARGATAQSYYNIDAGIYQMTLDGKNAEALDVTSSDSVYFFMQDSTVVYEIDDGLYRNGICVIENATGSFTLRDGRCELSLHVDTYPEMRLYMGGIE